MDMMPRQTEHEDLEEKFQIAADVSFNTSEAEFEGLKDMEIVIKKKEIKNEKIQNIELRKRNTRDRGLF